MNTTYSSHRALKFQKKKMIWGNYSNCLTHTLPNELFLDVEGTLGIAN